MKKFLSLLFLFSVLLMAQEKNSFPSFRSDFQGPPEREREQPPPGRNSPEDKRLREYVESMQRKNRANMERDSKKYGKQYSQIARDALGIFMQRGKAPVGSCERATKLLVTRYPDSYAVKMFNETQILILCYRGDVKTAELMLKNQHYKSWGENLCCFGFETTPTVLAYFVIYYDTQRKVKTKNEYLGILKANYPGSFIFPRRESGQKPFSVKDFVYNPLKYKKYLQ